MLIRFSLYMHHTTHCINYINVYFAIWQHKQTNKQKKCTEKQSNTQELYTRKINETELHI